MSEQTAETLIDGRIKVKHLTNSLAQITLWIEAVQSVLFQLDPNMEIELPPKEAKPWLSAVGPIITHMNCPPPD